MSHWRYPHHERQAERWAAFTIGAFVGFCAGIAIGLMIATASAQQLQPPPALQPGTILYVGSDGLAHEIEHPTRATPLAGKSYLSSVPSPQCEEGWTLVATTSMRPMCARELKEPK